MTGPGDLQPPEFPQVQLLAIHTSNVTSSIPPVGLTNPTGCDAKCASIATRNTTPQASASGSTEPHETTEPAATIQVAAGSSVFAPVTKTGLRHEAAQKTARRGQGWPGGREEVAGTGTEQTRFHTGKQGVESVCDAECDAFSPNRIDLLTRAVILVAGMNLAEAERASVLARLVAELTEGSGPG
jgi:hypothetical protein